MINSAISGKIKSILSELSKQVVAINVNTNYIADLLYDGKDHTVQVNIYSFQGNGYKLKFTQKEQFKVNDKVSRLNTYRQFVKMRVEILEQYNQALCRTE